LVLLYDYTFRPPQVPAREAVAWARRSGVLCVDEARLHPDPYCSRSEWCRVRCQLTEQRLQEVQGPLVLVNHFPLLQEHARLPSIPRFSIWCGTTRTRDWHHRFAVRAVVYGHLHIRSSKVCDGVRFEEVSLGYPRHWRQERGVAHYLREILSSD
jgi:hypothetical protein